MRMTQAPLPGAHLIDPEIHGDERGFFARVFCSNEFAEHGLSTHFVQINDSLSVTKGTLRGVHYQLSPKGETKVVRCICGALWDVILDLRKESPTFGRWFGAELTEENRCMMYVPKGFGHGFITLTDNVEVLYLVDEFYAPKYERGVRWNDPKFKIGWPAEPVVMSDKDRGYPDFDPAYHLAGPVEGE